jgi:hypothetical protein
MTSNYDRCKKCGGWGWIDSHTCPPIWEARVHETKWEEHWHEVYARDAEDAAEKFAERSDCEGDYTIIQTGCAEIEVRKLGETETVIVDISAETVPQYRGEVRNEKTA